MRWFQIRNQKLKVVLDKSSLCVCVLGGGDATRVWCLVAEGDYVRITVFVSVAFRNRNGRQRIMLVHVLFLCVCGWWEYDRLLIFA